MIIEAPFGDLRVFIKDGLIVEILLPGWKPQISPPSDERPSGKIEHAFKRYFGSEDHTEVARGWEDLLALTDLDFNATSPFEQRVYRSLTDFVRSGQTTSYGELAALAGSPRAARAVGSAMRRNPLPIVVPCHRVLRSDGNFGGYMGTAEVGITIKKWLLGHEGAI